jgi:hypothetical protein
MDQFCKAPIKFISFALTPNEPHKEPRLVSFNTMAWNETNLKDSQTWRVCSEEAFMSDRKSFKKVIFQGGLFFPRHPPSPTNAHCIVL